MGGGIMQLNGAVRRRGDDLSACGIQYYGANRRLAARGGVLRRLKGDAHVAKIMVHDSQPTDPQSPGQGAERVAKALARAGVASRRDVERLIAEGRVALNGKILNTPAVKVEPGDILTVDGEVVADAEPVRLFRYHKPVGLVTTHKDPQGRPTVFEALPEGLPRLISVGRLDLNTEGLLLLTNDGELARALEMPASGVVRRYRARARGRIAQERLDRLRDGVTVDGVRYGPIDARLDKAKEGPQGANLWITLTLAEGKNREVRRVLESLGLKVNRLIRLSYGPFALGPLESGSIEEVGPRVIREQLAELIPEERMPKGDRPQFVARKTGPLRRAASQGSATGQRGGAASADPSGRPDAESGARKKVYKAGWAKAKPPARPPGKSGARKAPGRKALDPRASGSGQASDRPAARPGPKRFSSPRQTSGAHREGPPKGGGPKRRG